MFEEGFEGPKTRLDSEDDADDLGDLAVEQVIGTPGGNLLFAESPLAPSRPGCAGDLGTVAGVRVVDVVEEPAGLLHVMDDLVRVHSGDRVPIWRDPERHDRLERAHTATVACRALLAQMRVPVVSTEIVAGLAWVEIEGPAPLVNLAPLAARNERIEVLARRAGTMTVYLGGEAIRTVEAPIGASTSAATGAEVRPVASLDVGREALEITLPDGEGAIWWR